MKIAIESTDQITILDGIDCRVWEGVTEAGIACTVFVHRVAVDRRQDWAAFDRELAERMPPGRVVPLRNVL